jgi:hypothetical protein
MKLSAETLTVLRNFASINQSILLKPGKTLATISPQKTVMAKATVEDEFPVQAGIYDLSKFLSVHSLYEDPDLQFSENFLAFVEGKSRAKYVYADPSMIITPPEKDVKLPSIDVEVELTSAVKWKG